MFAGKGIIWMGRALLMNPIGLAITAIAGAAYLIYENWDKLKPWFTALWDDIVAKFETAVVKIGGMIDSVKQKWNDTKDAVTGGVGSAWASTKEFFGFGDNKAQSKPASQPSNLPLPAIASSRSRGNTYQDNSQTTVQVTQLPGESQQALAKRIVAEQERMRAVRQRSMMTDGVIAQ